MSMTSVKKVPLQYSQKCSKTEYYFEMETNYIKMSLELIKSRTVNIKTKGGLGIEGYRTGNQG